MAPVGVTGLEMRTHWALPLGVLVFFGATAAGYGVFRDELYYFACARHLAWGYVDHPPGVALLAALVRALFGDAWPASCRRPRRRPPSSSATRQESWAAGGGRASSRSF